MQSWPLCTALQKIHSNPKLLETYLVVPHIVIRLHVVKEDRRLLANFTTRFASKLAHTLTVLIQCILYTTMCLAEKHVVKKKYYGAGIILYHLHT